MTKTRKRRKGGAFFGLVQGGTFSEGCGSLKDEEGKACAEKHNLDILLNCVQDARICLGTTLKCLNKAPKVNTIDNTTIIGMLKGPNDLLHKQEKQIHKLTKKVQDRIDKIKATKKASTDAAKNKKKLADNLKSSRRTKKNRYFKKGEWGVHWRGGKTKRRKKRRSRRGRRKTRRRR